MIAINMVKLAGMEEGILKQLSVITAKSEVMNLNRNKPLQKYLVYLGMNTIGSLWWRY